MFMTRRQWRQQVQRAMPVRVRVHRAAPTHAKPKKWETCVGQSGRLTCKALTKSEARARFKAELALDRLPPGTIVRVIR